MPLAIDLEPPWAGVPAAAMPLAKDAATAKLCTIQFPLYEKLKRKWQSGAPVTAMQASVCGSIAGCLAGAVTTPLDVTKTRLMLGKDQHGVTYTGMVNTMGRIYGDEGVTALFSGLVPRVAWISLGGAIFLGCYEEAKMQLINQL